VTTAVGAYATRTLLEARIGGTQTYSVADQALMTTICDQVNQHIEDKTGRVLAPIASTTYLYDGDGTRSLFLPLPVDKAPIGGVRAITKLEVAPSTGAGFVELATTDYFLRQRVSMTAMLERVVLSDRPSTGFGVFPRGMSNVRTTATAGPTAIPDDITDIALTVAQRAWNGRESGHQNVAGQDEQGRPLIARFFQLPEYETLRRYTLAENLA
jgi:hypothetical protein